MPLNSFVLQIQISFVYIPHIRLARDIVTTRTAIITSKRTLLRSRNWLASAPSLLIQKIVRGESLRVSDAFIHCWKYARILYLARWETCIVRIRDMTRLHLHAEGGGERRNGGRKCANATHSRVMHATLSRRPPHVFVSQLYICTYIWTMIFVIYREKVDYLRQDFLILEWNVFIRNTVLV